MTFYEQQCASSISGQGFNPRYSSILGQGLSPCFSCPKVRELSETLNKSIMLMERLKDAETLADSLRETIDAKDEQIKFLSEYIKSGGTKIFEDC